MWLKEWILEGQTREVSTDRGNITSFRDLLNLPRRAVCDMERTVDDIKDWNKSATINFVSQ